VRVSDRGDDSAACSIAATLDVIGDRWTILILREVFRGRHRFSDIHNELGVARNLLSDRLTHLVDAGVLNRVKYQDRPTRFEYRLSPKGADLSASLIALMKWGDRWYAGDRPPTILVHRECGTPLNLQVRCARCTTEVSPGHIRSASPDQLLLGGS
jgi:DNA-binding HxlR family transcriptional regulator